MTLETPQLERVLRRPRLNAPEPRAGERCDLCANALADDHRHLLHVEEGRLLCACDACRVLFDRAGAGGARYRLVPDRRLHLDGFRLDDALWDELEVPVGIVFFVRSSRAGRIGAFYPGPMGAAESLLRLEAWGALEEANPVLRDLEPEVEALLVSRAGGAREHFIVPLDDCYRLVATIRQSWKGLTGGSEARSGIRKFFDAVRARSRPAMS